MSIGHKVFGKIHDHVWKSRKKVQAGPQREKKLMGQSRRGCAKSLRIK